MLASADSDLAAGRDQKAEGLYQRVLAMSPGNPRALDGLDAVAKVKRHRAEVQRAVDAEAKGQVEFALDLLNKVLLENPDHREARETRREIRDRRFKQVIAAPQLRSRYTLPISLEFRDAGLRQVFDALSKGSGLNFIFDKDVRPDLRVSISVRNVLIESAIALLLEPNQLAGKVLNDNTMLIYPSTQAKVRDYQDLVIRSFYLENADVKQTQNMIKTMLKTKDTFIDEKLNLLVIRDTPEVVKLAESLISVQDHAEPEVMLEIEVLEILRSRLSQLGIQFPDQWQLNLRGLAAPGGGGSLNLKNEAGTSNLLSNPRIRVRNREKARILIGNRIPVISSVVTPNVASPVITDNIQYLDVGLKLEIEPNIHLDGSVMIKMNLEVSTLGDQVTSKNGTVAFRVGTRTAATTLQLKDGETQTLMGLIQDDEIERASRLPGVGEIPVLGRLFSNVRSDGQKTEIVLGITPRIVRNVPRPTLEVAALWSGTEATYRTATPLLNMPEDALKMPARAAVTGAPVASPRPAGGGSPTAGESFELVWKGPEKVKPGERFTVTLEGASNLAINGADLQLLFDPAALSVVRVAEGDWMRRESAQTTFNQRADPVTGRVYAGIRRNSGSGISGKGSLLSVTFQATGNEGDTQVHVATAVPSLDGGGYMNVKSGGSMQLRVTAAQ